MGKESPNRLKHFAALKSKYQATQYQDSSPASLLYLILRKLDLGIELSDLESNWLQEHELFETLEIIWLQQFRMGESKRLEAEFSHLKAKYKVAKNWESSVGNVLYPILWKLDSENSLTDSEVKLLQENNLTQIVTIVQYIKRFAELKDKYQATKYQDSHPDSRLYRILKKLDTEASLNDNEYEWLLNNELFETIEIFEKKESATRAKVTQLKNKYQAIDELEALTPDNPFRKAALELLYNLQQNLQFTQNQDEEDRELLMRLAPLYQQDREQAIQEGEQRGLQTGLQTGIQQGERLVVENLLKVRFGEIDNELQAIIEPLLSLAPEEFTPLLLQLSREELIHRFC